MRKKATTRRTLARLVASLGIVLTLVSVFVLIDIWSGFGARPSGERLERIQNSEQFRNGSLGNQLPEYSASTLPMLWKWMFGAIDDRKPSDPLPVAARRASDFEGSDSSLRVTWLGHSTLLIELDGYRILTDPVWGDYASPGRFFGVKRFFDPPLPLDQIPSVDAVVVSHDHYDHLNEFTIRHLALRVPEFIVPLGLGAHLEAWGVPPDRITELDWWERTMIAKPKADFRSTDDTDIAPDGSIRSDSLVIVSTPARHFSGRSFLDRNKTLWSSWAFLGVSRRVYFSGDTGMFPEFKQIGDTLGPFDITLMETGAYSSDWPDVHLGPEQAVSAHKLLRGNLMLPIHWGLFNLAFHSWTEPAERVLAAAQDSSVLVVIPRPGESVDIRDVPRPVRWWPSTPWSTAQQSPVASTGLD